MPTVTGSTRLAFIDSELAKKQPTKSNIEVNHDDQRNWMQATTDGGMVGGRVKDNELHIKHADLDEKKQGQGIGKAMYQALIDHAHSKGMKVFSDTTVENPAVNVYRSLAKDKYDVKQSDGVGELPPDEDVPHGALYGKDVKTPVFEIRPKK